MFDILGQHIASFFLNASDIPPSPEVISDLLRLFQNEGMLPSTFQELGPRGPIPQPRLILQTANNEWTIQFASNRFDIAKNPTTNNGSNIGDIATFTNNVTDYFTRILNHFNRRGTRLSIATHGIMGEMTELQLESIYRKVIRPISFYDSNAPIEWDLRICSRITTDSNEPINAITIIKKVRGALIGPTGSVNFNRISIDFDINTLAENNETRFTSSSLNSFFTNAIMVRRNILTQIEEMINA